MTNPTTTPAPGAAPETAAPCPNPQCAADRADHARTRTALDAAHADIHTMRHDLNDLVDVEDPHTYLPAWPDLINRARELLHTAHLLLYGTDNDRADHAHLLLHGTTEPGQKHDTPTTTSPTDPAF